MTVMEVEVGRFYRVDHSKCPKSTSLPNSLHSIRAVFVNEKNKDDITVSFPSKNSLNNFFGGDKLLYRLRQPNLDEKFVMSLNLGKKILTQRIPFEEFAAKRVVKNFWVLCNDGKKDADDGKNDGLKMIWERKSRTKVYTRRTLDHHDNKNSDNQVVIKCNNEINQGNDHPIIEVCDEDDHEGDENDDDDVEEITEKPRILRKRKCQSNVVNYSDKKKKKQSKGSSKKFIDPRHRWTVERYKLAEENMLKILKEKGAGPDNPILRSDLRATARKKIGDTGLLDHLLKHMAGKVAPGGKERFCRRHRPEGAMEYWLESADLVEVRKQVGVVDPSWVPPPGWKLGDCPNQDPICAMRLNELRQEVISMKREVGELSACSKEPEKRVVNDPVRIESVAESQSFMDSLKPLREMYEELLKKRAHVESELKAMSKSYSGMEEEVERLNILAASSEKSAATNEAEVPKNKELMVSLTPKPKPHEYIPKDVATTKLAAENQERKQQLKSAFTVCKPQGSFLWPSQVTSSDQSQVVLHLDDFVGCPTPPSVTSSFCRPSSYMTFPPPPYHHYYLHHSPRPVARPVATRADVTLLLSTSNIGGSTTIESIASPSTITTSSDFQSFVPDLNKVPVT